MGETTFVIGGEAAKARLHQEIEKRMKDYAKEAAADLKQFAHQSYTPKLPGICSIAFGIYRNGGSFRRENRNLYFKMMKQAHAWKHHYIDTIRATSLQWLITYATRELKLWQERWERSRELCICCMTSVTISYTAPVPSVTSTGIKRRAPSDVEDD
jgi:hypothetical protein